MTEADRYVRAVTFWGIWSVDKEYSALVGRPCNVRHVVITCPKPNYWPQEDYDWWTAQSTANLTVPPESRWHGVTRVCRSLCSLRCLWAQSKIRPLAGEASIEMAGVHLKATERLLWTEQEASPAARSSALQESVDAARRAISLLPPVEDIRQRGHSPHIITLHMIYRCHLVIINRPYVVRDFDGTVDDTRASRPSSPNSDSPRTRCFHAAAEIVRLMRMYRDLTPQRLQHILNCHQHNIVIAAAMLIYQTTSTADTFFKATAFRDAEVALQHAFELLEEMAVHRPAAKQALMNLKSSLSARRKDVQRSEPSVLPVVPQADWTYQLPDSHTFADAALDLNSYATQSLPTFDLEFPATDDFSDLDFFLQQSSYLFGQPQT